jgi:hypothetical protein
MKIVKMIKFIKLGLLLFIFLCIGVQAQTIATTVEKLEIDGKIVKKDYKVFLYTNDKRIEAKRVKEGFIIPDELKNEEYLGTEITFGKYKLDFSKIHISNFTVSWIIGVDKKPFSDEFVKPEDVSSTKQVYYIEFSGEPGRRLVVTIK